MEARKLSETCYVLEGTTNLGVLLDEDGDAWLVDSGADAKTGAEVLAWFNERGFRLRAILNTHSHADHIGGNHFLQQATGCRIFAPEGELAFVERPELELDMLYGAPAPAGFHHRIFTADGSRAEGIRTAGLPRGLSLIPLPGHSMDMLGFRTKDGIVFLADSVVSEETLRRNALVYAWDMCQAMESLRSILEMDAAFWVPSHAEITESVRPLVMQNLFGLEALQDRILELCRVPVSHEMLLKALLADSGMHVYPARDVLLSAALRGWLTGLARTDRIRSELTDAQLVWHCI